MGAFEVWFADGPVDGRIMTVETDVYGALPEIVCLPEVGVYIGANDDPAPKVEHRYRLTRDGDSNVTYQYWHSTEAD
ncbi:hypothetical protein [Micromonospora chersina]|uniref:hypothetical protein n=1 Tax=Micromonospora chersina TaxID=47854 RepID=UPI0037127D5C